MTVHQVRPALRWLVPLTVAGVLAAGASTVGVITAAARSGLPHRSAAQLLVDVQKARLDGLSGTVVQNADLGLPSLPGVSGGSGSSDLTSLVSGSHTLRLWYAGPDRARLALLGSLGESDVVRNGRDLWTWSSSTHSATHHTLPKHTPDTPRSLASASPVTPQQAADMALKAISPSTKVSTDGTAVVAGRPAYELVLTPRDRATLVGSVQIAIDGSTHVPLRVQVFPRGGSKPAFEVGFTSFDPTRPDASVFTFNPPPGTKVTESGTAMLPKARPHGPSSGGQHGHHGAPTVVGSGWSSVVVAKLPAGAMRGSTTGGPSGSPGSPDPAQLLKALPSTSGSWGTGHVLRGTLFSAVLTDDGRLAVGAVAPQALYRALAAS
jgi:outer membrane lipoprotein-sorting protein